VATKTITVDIIPSGGGTVEIDGDAPPEYPYDFAVESGCDTKIEAVPEDGYHFVKWIGEPTVKDNPELEPVIRNMSIIALFAPDFVEFTSPDGMVSVIVPEGVAALDAAGNPLTDVEFVAIKNAPDPPEDVSIIGMPYQLEPEGTTFDQPVILTWNYDTNDIPEGITEEDLIITRCDNFDDGVQELELEVDAENDTISAYIDHFSCFTVIAFSTSLPASPVTPSLPTSPVMPTTFTLSSLSISPPEVSTGETVTISVFLANTGEVAGNYAATLKINGLIAETREVSLTGGTSEMVTFTTSQGEAGAYSIDINGLPGSFTVKEGASPPVVAAPAPPGERNWWLTRGVIIATAAAIAIPLIIRWWRRRSDSGSLGDYISMR